MKAAFSAFIFSFVILFSLGAQTAASGDDNNNDFNNDQVPVMEGGGLTIVGSKSTTQQMDTVDRDTIDKTNAPDVPALLQDTLGLGTTRYGPYGNGANVNIRGFDSKRTAVLIDGVPVNSTASGDFDFNSIDPASIERIEVIHGGSDTKYNVSGALGGVINIITVKSQKPGWSLGGGISNTSYLPGKYNKQYGGTGNPQWQDLADTQKVNVFGAYGAEKYSFKIGVYGNRAANHFLYQDDYGYARRKEGNEVTDGGTNLSYIREFQDLTKLITTGAFYYGNKNIPVSGYSSEYAVEKDISSRENVMLDMPRAFNDNLAMELSLGHNWNRINYNPDLSASRHDEHSLSLINRWSWYPGTKFTFRFGGDYDFNNLDSTDAGLHYGNRGGLYVTSEYQPVKSLLLIASVKGITDTREIIPVPKLGVSWTINNSLTLNNNYYRSFKFPDFNDLYWMQDGFMGNPDLKSEDGWGSDLSANFSLGDNFGFNSTVYGQWTQNSIHWNNASGSWRPENSGTATLFGWDNNLKWTLPFSVGPVEKPSLGLSWLYQLSWLLSGDLSYSDSKRIPYMPMHTLEASLELPWKTKNKNLPGSVNISGRFESLRYADTGNIMELDPCFILNINYNQKLNKNLSLYAKINNALNASYVSFADYPMPGINITLGINMIFDGVGKQSNGSPAGEELPALP